MNIGTAIAGSDYVAVSETLVFPTGSVDGNSECINITITNDEIFEAEETFTVTLTVITADVLLGIDMITGIIGDNG